MVARIAEVCALGPDGEGLMAMLASLGPALDDMLDGRSAATGRSGR
jgi:hypothetical protein